MPPAQKKASRAAEAARVRELRSEKFDQINEIVDRLRAQLQEKRGHIRQRELLDSVSLGLYEEVDKLCKKAPAEPVTDLVLSQMNDVIRETKQLAISDVYVQRLNEFVAAGDNPQHRDAVVVLRQLRQGLERYKAELEAKLDAVRQRVHEAESIQLALRLHLESNDIVYTKQMLEWGLSAPDKWTQGSLGHQYFDLDKLDQVDIAEYFAEKEQV